MATQHETRGASRDAVGRPRPPVEETVDFHTTAPDPPARRRRTAPLAVSAIAVLVAAGAVGGFLLTRADTQTVTVSDRGGALPGAPDAAAVTEGLRVSLTGPARVVAGAPAAFTVAYVDDDGEFLGSTQDWGDAGEGSQTQGRCPSNGHVGAALNDSFVATHTWTAPGTYRVRITVTTRTCADGTQATEEKSASATVVVTAR